MSNLADKVMEQIFSQEVGWNREDRAFLENCPTFTNIQEIAALLASDCREEELQVFLENQPKFLLSLFGIGDDGNLAFLVKPPVGSTYKADFAIIEYGQGGCYIWLVELERANANLFTEKGTPARDLQNALGQITDWKQWISVNKTTFSRDTITYAKNLPMFPQRASNNSFRLRPAESMEGAWRGFHGYDRPKIKYIIIIGRWANLTPTQRERLIFLNSEDNTNPVATIYTYDQVARRAFDRPHFGY